MRLSSSYLAATVLVLGACIPDAIIESASDSKGSNESSTGDGDGDSATASASATDTVGDGDGDADTLGDGDGDETLGDGDGDDTVGDGDGDTGDGDGDMGGGDPGPDVCSSVQFAEVGDLALVGLAPGLDFGPQDAFTVAAWAYLAGGDEEKGYLVAKGDANTSEWSLTSAGDNLCFNQEGVGAIACTKINTQSWHHYAAVYMAEAVRLYQDGMLLENNNGPIGEPSASALHIGARDALGGALDGYIDDLAIWNTSLSEAELGQLASDSALPWELANANLVGWWRFGEGSGNFIADDSGSGLTANLQGSRWSSACHGGVCSSMELDMNNDGVRVPPDPALDYGPGDDFSLAAWANLYGQPSHIVVKGDNGSNEWSLTWTEQDGLCFNRQGQEILACGAAPSGGWHQYGFSHAAGQINLYVDGELVGSGMGMIGASQQTPLKLGYINNSNVLQGALDEVALFDAALSEAEFVALASRASRADDLGGLVGWWTWDEGTGMSVGDGSASGNEGNVLDGDWLETCAP